MTGHTAWGDPVNHPWTTGAPNPTYSTESILWGSFIEQHISEFPAGEKIKVASLVQNNDFGKLYDAAFKQFVAETPALKDRISYVNETIEASAPTVTDPMTTLAAEKPAVWISMLAGTAVHADRERGGAERHEGRGQVPLHAPDLRRRVVHQQGQARW